MEAGLKKASLAVSFHRNNRIFDIHDPVVNRDDVTRQWWELREEFRRRGYELATLDLHPPEESDVVVYHDVPIEPPSPELKDRSILLTMESPVVKARAWEPAVQQRFRKVLTWNDDLVDGKRFFKLRYGFHFPDSVPMDLDGKDKLCTTIVGRKKSHVPGELYSQRLAAIYWFERHHPTEFDFYGMGWEGKKAPLDKQLLGLLNGWKPLGSYRGKVTSKMDTYRRYRFAICYENCRVNGYITEKIFDCFFAGVIPIYLGAPNILDYVPESCFIDNRSYSTYSKLYERLKSIDLPEYLGYLKSMEEFLQSEKAAPFRATSFAKTVVDAALG